MPCFGKSGYFMPRCICQCQREAEEQRKAAEERQRRMERIKRRKAQGLQDRYLYDYTFSNDNGQNPLMDKAHAYVENWKEAYKSNIGLLLFGDTRIHLQGGRELMSNLFTERVLNMAAVTPQPEDYTGEDGLLYCGKCHTPKEAYFPEKQAALFGRDRHPAECDCQKAQRLEREAAEQRRKHLDTVEDLKRQGFTNPTMQEWTFANDNGKCPQMEIAHFYVEHWEIMREENIGYLLWGKVGTGKSYFAGCIANALMEQEVAVRMTNFSAILNDLTASFEGRNEYIERLCRFPLLIIDDFGMERGTEYGLEQVYNVIDSRYRSRKPLIVTTNLTLDSLQNPLDTAHARIYDRLLEMCAPILFTGENFRRETAQAKLNRLKELMK